jgi:hypothetical protein
MAAQLENVSIFKVTVPTVVQLALFVRLEQVVPVESALTLCLIRTTVVTLAML